MFHLHVDGPVTEGAYQGERAYKPQFTVVPGNREADKNEQNLSWTIKLYLLEE